MNIEELVTKLPEADREEGKKTIQAAILAGDRLAGIDSEEKARDFIFNTPILKSTLDAYTGKAITTFEKEKVPKIVEAAIAKVTGPETDPLKLEIKQIKAERDAERAELKREKLMRIAVQTAADEGIPAEDIARFLDEDEDRTAASVKAFAKRWKAYAEAKVEEKLKAQFGNAGAPRNGTTTAPDIVKQYNDLRAAGKIDEANSLWIKSQGLMTKG